MTTHIIDYTTHPKLLSEMDFAEILKSGQVLASGGYGMVLGYRERALKLLRSATTCHQAAAEYKYMEIVYKAFETARGVQVTPRVARALQRLHPIQPIEKWEKKFFYRGETFSCAFVTSLAKGAPLKELKWFTTNITPGLLQLYPVLLVLPSLTAPSGVSVMDASNPLSKANPPRYFIMSQEDARQYYHGSFDFDFEFPYAMGVLLAVTTFIAKIVLVDVEILLGRFDDASINILDFGMCQPLDETKNIGDQICDTSGPFFTKDVFPNDPESNEFGVFIHGFEDAAHCFGKPTSLVKRVVDEMVDAL